MNNPIGIFEDYPEKDYHADNSMSRSMAWKAYEKSWAHAVLPEEDKRAFAKGTAFHYALLQPALFESECVRGPVDRRGNKWKDAVGEHPGKLVLTEKEYDNAQRMRDKVVGDPRLWGLFGAGNAKTEVSAFAHDPEFDIRVRCRMDWVLEDMAIDVKSCACATKRFVQRAIADRGYYFQEAMYRKVWDLARSQGEGLPKNIRAFAFLFMETTPPFEYRMLTLDEDAFAEGEAVYRRMAKEYNLNVREGEWPGFGRDVETMSLPMWAFREIEPMGG